MLPSTFHLSSLLLTHHRYKRGLLEFLSANFPSHTGSYLGLMPPQMEAGCNEKGHGECWSVCTLLMPHPILPAGKLSTSNLCKEVLDLRHRILVCFGGLTYCEFNISTNSHCFAIIFKDRYDWRGPICQLDFAQMSLYFVVGLTLSIMSFSEYGTDLAL